jgi:hypothetical protein
VHSNVPIFFLKDKKIVIDIRRTPKNSQSCNRKNSISNNKRIDADQFQKASILFWFILKCQSLIHYRYFFIYITVLHILFVLSKIKSYNDIKFFVRGLYFLVINYVYNCKAIVCLVKTLTRCYPDSSGPKVFWFFKKLKELLYHFSFLISYVMRNLNVLIWFT